MGRKVQYNNIVSPELLSQVNPDNIELGKDFIDYLRSIDRAGSTLEAYEHDLNIFGSIYFNIVITNFLLIYPNVKFLNIKVIV